MIGRDILGFADIALKVVQLRRCQQGGLLRWAITVIGGLLVSTLLTLVVIPAVYVLLDRRSDAAYRERGERNHNTVVDEATLAAGAAMS